MHNLSPSDAITILEDLASHGVPRENAAIQLDVGTGAFLEFFQREILHDLVSHGGATCRFYEGPYGSGKTHLLQLLQLLAVQRNMLTVRTDLSRALHLEDWRSIVRFILNEIQWHSPHGPVRTFPAIIRARRALLCDGHVPKLSGLPHPGFRRAIECLIAEHGDDPFTLEPLTNYLLGERIPSTTLAQCGYCGIRDPLSARNAEHVLVTTLTAAFRLGFGGTVLLFDENEHSFTFSRTIPPRRVQTGANLIRRFIDSCHSGAIEGVAAIFSVLPEFLDNASIAYPALGQRIRVLNGERARGAWRWTVLPVAAISTLSTPEDFVAEVAEKLIALAETAGRVPVAQRGRLHSIGINALQGEASASYRRVVIKAMAHEILTARA